MTDRAHLPRACRLVALLLLAGSGVLAAQEAPDSLATVWFRPTVARDRTTASVAEYLARAVDPARWRPYVVRAGTTIDGLIHEAYGLDASFTRTMGVMRELILQASDIVEPTALQVGDTLLLPPVPRLMAVQPGLLLEQAWNADSGTVGRPREFRARRRRTPATEWAIRGYPGQLEDVTEIVTSLANSPDELAAIVDEEPRDQVANADLGEDAADPVEEGDLEPGAAKEPGEVSAEGVEPPLDLGLGNLQPVGRLVLVDFFRDPDGCGHGRLVWRSAVQVFQELGIPQFVAALDTVEVDAMANQAGFQGYIDAFARRDREVDPENERKLKEYAAKAMEKARTAGMPNPVSLLYVQALWDSLLRRRDATVVSSSFTIRNVRFQAIPAQSIRRNQAIFLSAVGERKKGEGGTEDRWEHLPFSNYRQPQQAYLNLDKGRFPTLLVGGMTRDGARFGYWSEKGTVPVLDLAEAGADELCLTPKRGTSFSTPRLAALVFVAIARWRADGLEVPDYTTLLWRLAATANIKPRLLGVFPVPGPPTPALLVAPPGRFMVNAAGRRVPLKSIKGTATLAGPDGARTAVVNLGDAEFSGLVLSREADYLLLENKTAVPKWQPGRLSDLDIELTTDGGACNAAGETTCRFTTRAAMAAELRRIGRM
ncbi:MAG: hypothetical protein U0104_13440 [Gemmatimonadales bacterium]